MSYETKDASLRIIGFSAALLGLGVALAFAVSLWLYGRHAPAFALSGAPGRQTSFTTGATYEPDVTRSWKEVNADAEHQLHRYAWVDRSTGVVQIPIDRAMALVAAGKQAAPIPKPPGQVP